MKLHRKYFSHYNEDVHCALLALSPYNMTTQFAQQFFNSSGIKKRL